MPESVDRDVWFKFFPRDWRGDEQLHLCSLAARGLWIELMCLAHKSGGHVIVSGPKTQYVGTIARQVQAPPREVRRLLGELLKHRVCSQTDDGVIFSRRMESDAKVRERSRANGNRGGNPLLKKAMDIDPTASGITPGLTQPVNPRSRSRSRSRVPPPSPPSGVWRDECKTEHNSRCENRTFHAAMMAMKETP